MSSNPTDVWSPQEGTTTFTETLSPSRHSYTSDTQRLSSDGEDSAQYTRRLAVSPSPSQQDDDNVDDTYSDGNSLDEVDATLNDLEDELDDTEQALTEWSGSYSSGGPTFSSATGTFTYTGSYTGSPSFVSLPTFSPRSPPQHTTDPRIRLSRITERTEVSRPPSTAFSTSNVSRPANPTSDNPRRSTFLGGGTPSHSRSSTDPGSDRTLPPPGRLNELIAVFETQSPSAGHSRTASTPGYRSGSPMFGTSQSITTGYGTYSYGSRPSSPSKSGTGSSGSYTGTDMRSSLLSPPPPRPTTSSGFRSTTPGATRTGAYTSPSYSASPSTFTNTNTWNTNINAVTATGSYTTPNTESKAYTDTETFTRTSVTPTSGLRRPQASPRSPLASVRNIVALWKERTPAAGRPGEKSAPGSVSSISPPAAPAAENDGLYGIRRRVEGARARLRESRATSNPAVTPTRPISEGVPDNASIRSSGVFPPGFDMNEFSNYAQSKEPPIHIGLLWYLNVHASPPYRWQRCQALLYPHMLLLSWLAPGGGRGIVALDLLNCTSVQSAPSPTHPSARDDVGTIAARQQSGEPGGQPLMDMLVPFHMLYADGVERLAAESLLERQKWVNRLWEAVNRPITVQDSASVTRSPTGSIRTILSINSSSSHSSNGSRSTFFVPPLSSLPDISDFQSNTSGLSRQSSLVSSHHTRTVDDTVIQNQEYVYPGDPRVITPNRGSSLRRSGSMADLDEEFKSAINRARGSGALFGGSPVTISSGSSLGKNVFVTPPPSTGRGSDRARSDVSDEHFFSAGSSDGATSNVSSTYFSQTSLTSTGRLQTTTGLTATSDTQLAPSTLTSSFRLSESGTYRSDDSDISFADSPSTLSRAREIRRRVAGSARSHTSGYQTDTSQLLSDKENTASISGSESRTPTGSYTPGSAASSLSGSYSGSYLDSRSRTPSGSYTGSYTGSEHSRSDNQTGSYSGSGSYTGGGSYTPSGSYTPGSGSFTLRDESNGIDSTSTSGIGGHTPISSSETGYDICPSSDLTDWTRPTSESETATPFSRESETLSAVSVVASEKYVTVSQGSTEYATAIVPPQSPRGSITSFESLLTIPGSEYETAESTSTDYRTASEPGMETEFVTASEPSEPSPDSEYITAELDESEIEEIISEEVSTPVLSSLKFGSEPDEERSVVIIPSIVPSIRSPSSILSELLPEEIPLPPSAPTSVAPPPPQPLPMASASPSPSLTPSPAPLDSSASEPDIPTPTSFHMPMPSPSPSPSPSLSQSPAPLGSLVSESDVPTPTTFIMPPPSEPPAPDEQDMVDEDTVSLRPDVPTPTTFSMPPPSEPPAPDEQDTVDEDAVSSSLLSSLPPSTLGSTSVLTPTSLAISSASTASTLPPSTPVMPQTTVQSSSISQSSASSSGVLSSFTQISSSLMPPSPRPWATATDVSYESSILMPSPSIRSVALHEGVETSFETSIFRASGSPSSIGRMSTIPPSISAPPSARPQSPLQPLTPVPALPASISSPTDVATPTSLMFSSESSSSLGRTLSTYSSSSYLSQSSLSSSIFDSRSEIEDAEVEVGGVEVDEVDDELMGIDDELAEVEEELVPSLVPSPSTEPSLLSTPRMSSPTPIPTPRISTGATPEGSLVLSISTPQGSGETEQSSLRTIPSVSLATERDLGRDIDRLADELRTYDHARGLENQDIAENVRALRDELRDLAHFLHRTPTLSSASIAILPGVLATEVTPAPVVAPVSEAAPATMVAPIPAPAVGPPRQGVQLTDRPVGGSSILSSLFSAGPRDMETGVPAVHASSILSRSTSNASSVASYLSSHHSDDYIFEETDESAISTQIWQATTESSSSLDETDSLTSSSPLSRASMSSGGRTARPQALDGLEESLRTIHEQLHALENGQTSTRNLLDALQNREVHIPEDHTAELADRLHRIEDLVRSLVEQEHPRGPEIIISGPRPISEIEVAHDAPATSRTESISESSDSLSRLREILDRLAEPEEELHMPIPVTARTGLSMAQELGDILTSATNLTSTDAIEPPIVVPFVYQPAERGARARSASPETLPHRAGTAPPTYPPTYPQLHPARRRRRIPSEPDTSSQFTAPVPPPRPPTGDQRDVRPTQAQPPAPERVPTRGPPALPVVPILYDRPDTAPSALGAGSDPERPSWYRPSRARAEGARPPPPNIGPGPGPGPSGPQQQPQPQPQHHYIPMPAGPTVVQLPPLFDSLMEILRENRLAQLATVDQQRELMRYMRGLNEWLERDVHDRQSEIRGVVARVEQLSHDLRGIQMQGQHAPSESSTSDEGAVFVPSQGLQMPQPYGGLPPGGFVPGGFVPGGFTQGGLPPTFQPYPNQSRPVIPPAVPDTGTPPPSFRPVIPSMQPHPTIIVNPGGLQPPIPTDGYGHPVPGPMPMSTTPRRPEEPFIPPEFPSSRASTGEPRPYRPQSTQHVYPSGMTMGPSVVHVPPSPSSSISDSTPRSRSPIRRGDRRHDSRSSPDRRSSTRRTHPRSSTSHRRSSRGYRRDSRSRSSSGRRSQIPLVITNPSMVEGHQGIQHQPSMYPRTPTVHVIPPSVGSMSPRVHEGDHPFHPSSQPQQQQPTIIIQQPQQQPQQPIVIQAPSSPGVHGSDAGMPPSPGMSMGGMPMSGMPMGGMPMSGMPMTGVPMTGMPMGGVPMTGMPMGGMPMTGMPMGGMPMTGMPMGGMPMSGMPMGGPGIIMQPSRSSSRSRSRSSRRGRRRTPPPAPAAAPTAGPIIITDTRRSHSRSHSRGHRTPQPQMPPAGVTILPSQPLGPMGAPGGMVMMPSRSHSSGRRSHHSRRRHSPPPVIVNQPGPGPTMYPTTQSAPLQPAVFLPTGTMPGVGMMPGGGMVPGMPVMMHRSRSRSRSRSPRRGDPIIIPPGQPSYRHSRSRSPRHPRRSRSRSRSRSPRRRYPSPGRHHSRTPPRTQYPPTVPTAVPGHIPVGHYPTYRPSDSRSPSRRGATHVQVVPDPHARGRGEYSRSPRRHSPSRRRYPSQSPDYDHRRGYPPRDRRSPSYRDHDPRHGPSRSSSYGGRPHRPRTRYAGRERSYSPYRESDPSDRGPRRPRLSRSFSPRSARSRSRSPIPAPRSHRPRDTTPSPVGRTESGPRRPRLSRSFSPRSARSRSRSPIPVPRSHRPRDTTPSPVGRTDSSRRDADAHRGSPIPIHRSRSVASPPTGRSRSPPHVIVTRRHSRRRARRPSYPESGPGSDGPGSPRTPDTVRITVPSRTVETRRPPTVMAIDEQPHIPGVSRTPTRRRPSGDNGDYDTAHSVYGGPRDHSVQGPPVIPSGGHRSATPTHRPPAESRSATPTYHPRAESRDHSAHSPSRPAEGSSRRGEPADVQIDAPHAVPLPTHAEPLEGPESAPQDRRPGIVQPPPRQATATPFNFHVADDSRGQLEELNAAANRLHLTAAAAEEAEDQRELEFRSHEDHREQLFLQNEERRNQEARDRAAGVWNDVESRLSALPAPPDHPEEQPAFEEPAEPRVSDADSIRTISAIATQAATQHAADVMETVRLEREDAAREREEAVRERELLLAELRAEKDRVIEEKDARIRALEDELGQLRGEFEAEKDQRAAEETEIRERERQEFVERDEYVRAQLGDITNLVQDQRDMLETKKALMESRWEDKQARRQDKEAQMIELRDMIQKIYDDMETDRDRSEQQRQESKEGLEKVIEDLQRQNAEQRELLTSLSEGWRADCERHHQETLDAVRSTANEQVPFNVQGYLDEFSRALATEVRMLLGEVGKIREERRALQHEIGDLLCMKAKYGPGGEYEPDWKPPGPPPPPVDPMPPMPDIPGPPPAPVKPAWRTVHTRPKKKKKAEQAQQQAHPIPSTSAPLAQPMNYDLRRQLTGSWATWQPDRNNMTPPSVEPTLMVPRQNSPGLFGPRSNSTSSLNYEHR